MKILHFSEREMYVLSPKQDGLDELNNFLSSFQI